MTKKLNITLLHFKLQNIGGITSCISTRYRALKERGHNVRVFELTIRGVTGRAGAIRDREYYLKEQEDGTKRDNIHGTPRAGDSQNIDNEFWVAESEIFFPTENQIWFNSEEGIDAKTTITKTPFHIKGFQDFLQIARESDLFLWIEPFFTCNKDNFGIEFAKIYIEPKRVNPELKQVILCHDTRLEEGYPWLTPFVEGGYIDGVMASHVSAYRMMSVFDIPRVLTLVPSDIPQDTEAIIADDYSQREDALLTLSFFKSWKHGDTIYRIAPFLKRMAVYSAGSGIQKRYMMATDKCKPGYRWAAGDDGVEQEWIGERIWDIAKKFPNFHEHGWMPFALRDSILKRVKFGYDPAYHNPTDKTFEKLPISKSIRSHYNRTTIEAMTQGAVPIVDEWGFAYGDDGEGVLLKKDVNVLTMQRTKDPRELAEQLESFLNLPTEHLQRIRQENVKLLPNFSKEQAAIWIENFYNYLIGNWRGEEIGFFKHPVKGGNYFDIDIQDLYTSSRKLVEKAEVTEQFERYKLTR